MCRMVGKETHRLALSLHTHTQYFSACNLSRPKPEGEAMPPCITKRHMPQLSSSLENSRMEIFLKLKIKRHSRVFLQYKKKVVKRSQTHLAI